MCSHFCSEAGYKGHTHHQPQVLPLLGDFTAVPTFQLENTNRKVESCQLSGICAAPSPGPAAPHLEVPSEVLALGPQPGDVLQRGAELQPDPLQGKRRRGVSPGRPGSRLPPWPAGLRPRLPPTPMAVRILWNSLLSAPRCGRALSKDGGPALPAGLSRREAASALSQDGGRQRRATPERRKVPVGRGGKAGGTGVFSIERQLTTFFFFNRSGCLDNTDGLRESKGTVWQHYHGDHPQGLWGTPQSLLTNAAQQTC